MKQAKEVVWYENLVDRVLSGGLSVSITPCQEGIHDCLDLKVENVDSTHIDSLLYEPIFVLFYAPSDGVLSENNSGCKESGKFEFIYTYTENGFGEGVFLDETHNPELFKKVCELAHQALKKQRLHNKHEWYKTLVQRALAGELSYTTISNRGCVELTIKEVEPTRMGDVLLKPQVVLYYSPLPGDTPSNHQGVQPPGRKESNSFEYAYTATDDGFYGGLYLDSETFADLFNDVCKLAENGLSKEEERQVANWYEQLFDRLIFGDLTCELIQVAYNCLFLTFNNVAPLQAVNYAHKPALSLVYSDLPKTKSKDGSVDTFKNQDSRVIERVCTHCTWGLYYNFELTAIKYPSLFKKINRVICREVKSEATIESETIEVSSDVPSVLYSDEPVVSGDFVLPTGEMTRFEVIETATHQLFNVWLGDRLLSSVKQPKPSLNA